MSLETAADLALKQIEDKGYGQEFEKCGVGRIMQIGLAFEGSKLFVSAKK